MSKSLLSKSRECYVCGSTDTLHKHHVFFGTSNRKNSEEQGCWIYLCPHHHNMSNEGVHFNKELDLKLKQECQEAWEREKGTREDFRKVFGKSYL